MYEFPESLGVLKTWIAGRGVNLASVVTERQAAFKAQKIAGTFLGFPPKGQSCHAMLLEIQAAVIRNSEDRRAASNNSAPGPKPRPKPGSRPVDDSGLVIFTDGYASPNPGCGGWGFVAYRDGTEVFAKCSGDAKATNNLMELEAIASALIWLFYSRGTRPKGCPARIFSDSSYAVGVVTKSLRPKKNDAMIDCILGMLEDMPSVTVAWCRGHAGDKGSLRAHELAEQGRMPAVTANDNGEIAA